jgi:prevent-host-death family protein
VSTVGVRELKNRLTYYLRRARAGEEVIVTDRGKPVAVLQSLAAADRAAALPTRLARLGAIGLVRLPRGKGLKGARPVRLAGPAVSRAILEDRR